MHPRVIEREDAVCLRGFLTGVIDGNEEDNWTFAHGQMSERKLEQIMYDFINGDIDVLVSTTIIETIC